MMQFLMRTPHRRLHVHTDLWDPPVTLLICSLCCRVAAEDYACLGDALRYCGALESLTLHQMPSLGNASRRPSSSPPRQPTGAR